MLSICIVFFKQKTAYEMRISDWSSDVCSSDLKVACQALWKKLVEAGDIYLGSYSGWYAVRDEAYYAESELTDGPKGTKIAPSGAECEWGEEESYFFKLSRSEEQTSELQSLMRISSAVFCLIKQKILPTNDYNISTGHTHRSCIRNILI